MNKKDIQTAFEMGKQARAAGKNAPAQDSNLLNFIYKEGRSIYSIKLMDAWINGFRDAHHKITNSMLSK